MGTSTAARTNFVMWLLVQEEEDTSDHTWMALWLSFPIIHESTQLNFNGKDDNMPLI